MKSNVGVAHFGIPVTDMQRSIDFYCKVVGCQFIRADARYAFLDSNGVCVLLCLQKAPIRRPDDLDFLHHAFMVSAEDFPTVVEHLAAHGVEVEETEERSGGVIDGPRLYFRDPDGSRLEVIQRTNYNRTSKVAR
jgi:catechol 2,3-dioxygenase-like lactoylglutathione lyase family enzyme